MDKKSDDRWAEELKHSLSAEAEGKPLEVENALNDGELEEVSGGCLCRCGGDYNTCGGGGGGGSFQN
jgi:hypothetical protein